MRQKNIKKRQKILTAKFIFDILSTHLKKGRQINRKNFKKIAEKEKVDSRRQYVISVLEDRLEKVGV